MSSLFAAGPDFVEKGLVRSDFAAYGYANGVPMGGDLADIAEDESPSLLIRALRDPDGADLDRLQVIKGWVDADGSTQERVYDVACSDERAIVANRCEREVGSTVDVENATCTNGIGLGFLDAYWRDPEFDPSKRALYYVRVIEIPTPNWTTYDAAFFDIDRPEGAKPEQQERACTSPIWYTPERTRAIQCRRR